MTLLLATPLATLSPPAGADATTDELVDAALEQLDVDLPSDDVRAELATLLEQLGDAGAIAPEVLDVIAASDDPADIAPVLAEHLAQERLRWSEVGPAWTQARLMLGEQLGDCPLDEDSTCGLLLRTRLQTEASLRLAGDGECGEDCAQRLDRVRERLERTIRQVEQLGPGAAGPGTDVAQLLRDAEQARLRLQERIRVARGEAAGPGPGPASGAGAGPDSAPGPQGPVPAPTPTGGSTRGGDA
jgi:hypothetical protein